MTAGCLIILRVASLLEGREAYNEREETTAAQQLQLSSFAAAAPSQQQLRRSSSSVAAAAPSQQHYNLSVLSSEVRSPHSCAPPRIAAAA